MICTTTGRQNDTKCRGKGTKWIEREILQVSEGFQNKVLKSPDGKLRHRACFGEALDTTKMVLAHRNTSGL